MTLRFKAHFDGRVIVPDERVELPVDQSIDVTVACPVGVLLDPDDPKNWIGPSQTMAERLRAYEALRTLARPANVPDAAFDREDLYDDRI